MNRAAKLLARRKATLAPPWDLNTFLFKEQREFVFDTARFAVAVCSMRAGKTTACAADLVNTALTMPGTTGLYLTLARSSAERIIWPELKRIIRHYKLNAKINATKLWITFGNGSIIYLLGANDDEEINKVLGLSNVALVYLDECQSFRPSIKELVTQVVSKRLYDTNGRCRLIGTPGPLLSGYFYECSISDKWSSHSWTMYQNPWLLHKSGKTPEELTQQDCELQGVDLNDPNIQRNNFGKWVHDPQSLLLSYVPETNHYEELPKGDYIYILGIDFGVRDADSLTLLAFTRASSVTYLVEEIVKTNQTTDQLAKEIKGLCDKYPISNLVADCGALGLKIAEDLRTRYGLPIEAADKRDKMSNYKLLNSALRHGIFKAKKDSRFAVDCFLLERDEAKSEKQQKIIVKGHSDAIDSALYAFKLSPAYAYVPPKVGPAPGSDAYTKMQEELHIKAAMELVKKQKELAASGGVSSQMKTWNLDKKGVPDWNKW